MKIPPKDKADSDKSETVIVRYLAYDGTYQLSFGHYLYAHNHWAISGVLKKSIAEWWPLPYSGTGIPFEKDE